MTTLAAALTDSATEMRVNAADADPAPYYQIDSEVVRLLANSTTIQDGFSPSRTLDMTLWQIERGDAATTPASHLSGATVSPLWPQVDSGGGGTVLTQDIEDALNGAVSPSALNVFATYGDTALVAVLTAGNDASGLTITGLPDPTDDSDAATMAYADLAGAAKPLAEVLAAGNDIGDTGGNPAIISTPAVDVDAHANINATASGVGSAFTDTNATATGAGNAWARAQANVEDGNAIAGPWAEATGTGATDACAYARSVDGVALADNDAAATGTGEADAGGYAASFDGPARTGGIATATGSGNADASDIATANTGSATAGSLAVRGAVTVGMSAIVDGTSGRLAFNGTTPIAIPVLPASPTEQDIADVLVALGLVTQTP